MDTVVWNEMVFWSPYADICDYGINGYEKGGAKCQSSVDDGECYLLLLYQNNLVAKIKTNRQLVDFTKANWEKRVSKEKAVFRFLSKEDWPGVVLAAE